MTLSELADANEEISTLLQDTSIGHREAARLINTQIAPGTTTERSVRRYRAYRGINIDILVSPYGSARTTGHRPRRERSVPQWIPGIDIDEQGGELRTRPVVISSPASTASPEEAELLGEFGLDPAVWEITSARKSQWQSGDKWLEARRVAFRKRGNGFRLSTEDIEAVMSRYTPRTGGDSAASEFKGTLVVPSGDLQVGKHEGGGTAATADRFARIINKIAEKYHYGVENLVLPHLGDCLEGHVSQGGRNISMLDATPSEQLRVYRRLTMHQIGVLAPLARRVLIPVVPGNHDETTRQQTMPRGDSWAIEGAVAVQDWMQGRPEYAHVTFLFPDKSEPDVTVDVDGVTMAFVHGHTTGKGKPDGVIDWWRKQSHGRQLAGEADILVSAHWHHLRVEATGGNRTWIQIPALDGGSDWYRHQAGDDIDSGIISLELTPGKSPGWSNLTMWT